MLKVADEGIVLEGRDLAFEQVGVLNPACVLKDEIVHMFYRAVGRDNFSTIGYCQLKGNKVIKRLDNPVMAPEFDYERKGVEDPRITLLDGIYYMFYTAFDGQNARVAYATSRDLVKFEKQGLASPSISYDLAEDIFRNSGINKKYMFFEKVYRELRGDDVMLWEKDAALFPEKINGRYALMHRVLPGIQVIYFDRFEELKDENFWVKHLENLDEFILLDPEGKQENGYIGGGCVPIRVAGGWLLIYHSVEIREGRKTYRANAALLDGMNPQKLIGRLAESLFEPEENWEKRGVVDNVVFPTGAIVSDGVLYIYYGAADKKIALKSVKINELLSEIKK